MRDGFGNRCLSAQGSAEIRHHQGGSDTLSRDISDGYSELASR